MRSPTASIWSPFERTYDLGRDPAPVEVSFLGSDVHAVYRAFVHRSGIEGHVPRDRSVCGRRVGVGPRRITLHHLADSDAVVLRASLELARGGLLTGIEEVEPDILGGQVVGRGVTGIEYPDRPRALSYDLTREHHSDVLVGRLGPWWARVVPDRLLTRSCSILSGCTAAPSLSSDRFAEEYPPKLVATDSPASVRMAHYLRNRF